MQKYNIIIKQYATSPGMNNAFKFSSVRTAAAEASQDERADTNARAAI